MTAKDDYIPYRVKSSKYKPRTIKCLRCGRKFKSYDKVHNRICELCKRYFEKYDLYNSYIDPDFWQFK